MARKEARQIAMQLIYQYEMGGDGIASTIEETIEGPSLTTSDREYIDQVVLGAVERAQDLDCLLYTSCCSPSAARRSTPGRRS